MTRLNDWIYSVQSKDKTVTCGHQHLRRSGAVNCAINLARRHRKTFDILFWKRSDRIADEIETTFSLVESIDVVSQ